MSTENLLKRKNEEDAINEQATSTIKRVALDADALEDDLSMDIEVEGHDNGYSGSSEDRYSDSKISSHKLKQRNTESDDPTYTYFRILCSVKEAALVVGKGGEKINHIKTLSNARVNVSENIFGVTERIIHIRGSAENVAKVFGLIVRAILNENEDVPSGIESNPFSLQLLIPHPIMGYVIGKSGLKLREIEEKSAAKLVVSPNSMPFSTDRLLSITGVADAIHIATYYTAQVILENKANFKGSYIYYNPASAPPKPHGLPPNPMMFNPMHFANMPQPLNPDQFALGYGFNLSQNNNNNRNQNQNRNFVRNNRIRGQGQQQQQQHQQHANHFQSHQRITHIPQQRPGYDLSLPGGPHVMNGGFPMPQNGQVIQDIYIPNEYVGNVIGKGGKNLRQLQSTTGSRISISDPDPNSTERKITINGSTAGNQMAVFLINNKIESDMRSNEENARQKQQQQQQQQQNNQHGNGTDNNNSNGNNNENDNNDNNNNNNNNNDDEKMVVEKVTKKEE